MNHKITSRQVKKVFKLLDKYSSINVTFASEKLKIQPAKIEFIFALMIESGDVIKLSSKDVDLGGMTIHKSKYCIYNTLKSNVLSKSFTSKIFNKKNIIWIIFGAIAFILAFNKLIDDQFGFNFINWFLELFADKNESTGA